MLRPALWKSRRARAIALWAIAGLSLGWTSLAADEPGCLACDRELRKTFESIQAWRRLHDGEYPARLADLKLAGLMSADGAICPEVLRERPGARASHGAVTSRSDSADPPGTYEYEMCSKVDQFDDDRLYLPDDAAPYTRQDLKSVLLRRPLFEQIPILRCSSHGAVKPPAFAGEDPVFRNLTVAGTIYWSGLYWEQQWLDEVPYCARGANALFGLKGPPFCTDRAPTLPEAVDLRKWSCAFGDHAWWWDFPMFQENEHRQWAATLRPLFQENHGRVVNLGGTNWWLDGLIQLQGRVKDGDESIYVAPGMEAFVWQKAGLAVGRRFNSALWLQGTIWTAAPGQTVGWLVWHYADGTVQKAPIVYGQTTARFWSESASDITDPDVVQPAWRFHEEKAAVGVDRWLQIYCQEWRNPNPGEPVATVDFVSNRRCRAAPFLIALNLRP